MNNNTSQTTTTTHSLRRATFLTAASLLMPFTWTPPQAKAVTINVPAGSNIGSNFPSGLSAPNHNATFDLQGNVNWSPMRLDGSRTSAPSNITINSSDGNGGNYTITQTDFGSWLDYKSSSGSGSSHFFTLNDTLVQGDARYYSGYFGMFHSDNFDTTVTLNLEGSTFTGFYGRGVSNSGTIGLAYGKSKFIIDGGSKGVVFSNNKGANYDSGGAGVFGTYGENSSLTLKGNTTFEGNSTKDHGGALTIDSTNNSANIDNSWAKRTQLFVNPDKDGKAVFNGNSAQAFGGAINFWGFSTESIFSGEVKFTNNWTQGESISNQARRGGAINVGTERARSDITFKENVTFEGNRAIGSTQSDNRSQAWGGALSITAQGTSLTDITATAGNYSVVFEKAAVFKNNYVTSAATVANNKIGRGGAVYVGVGTTTNTKSVTFGGGTLFEENLAQSEGGAIYVSAISGTANSGGIVTLNADATGDITFRENYDGVSFNKTDDTNYTKIAASGKRNAIHFAGDGKLNINAVGTGTVHFHDPITGGTAAADNTVAVKKTGDGDVIFYGNDSVIHATTTVSGGKFILKDKASYGVKNSITAQTFTVGLGATLAGERGTTLLANSFTLSDGAALKLLADGNGTATDRLTIDTNSPVSISHTATLLFEIKGDTANNRAAGRLKIVNAPNFVGSTVPKLAFETGQWTENLSTLSNPDYVSITLIDGFGYTGPYITGSVIVPQIFGLTDNDLEINGGQFQFEHVNGSLLLNQIGTYAIPEPSTYALIGGIAMVALAAMRRKKNRA